MKRRQRLRKIYGYCPSPRKGTRTAALERGKCAIEPARLRVWLLWIRRGGGRVGPGIRAEHRQTTPSNQTVCAPSPPLGSANPSAASQGLHARAATPPPQPAPPRLSDAPCELHLPSPPLQQNKQHNNRTHLTFPCREKTGKKSQAVSMAPNPDSAPRMTVPMTVRRDSAAAATLCAGMPAGRGTYESARRNRKFGMR